MQVDNFYFYIDFIVIDIAHVTNACVQLPIILGRPFLATNNMVINCRNRVVKLSFGNMTTKLNMPTFCKQPSMFTKVQEVNLIEIVCEDDEITSLCISNLLEMVLGQALNYLIN